MEHVITTYGGGDLFILVFNAIATLFKEDRTGMVMSLIRVGLMVGSLYVLMLMFVKSSLQEGAKWFLWVVVATNLLFLPKTTIYIHDPLTKVKQKIDHIPFALGAFASFVSQAGRVITEKVESVFTLPNYMPYHQTGTVFASALMSQVGQFRIVDPIFKGNIERFINQCVVYDAMIGHKYTLTDLQNQNDLWAFVSSKASPVLGFLYKEGNNPGTIITCKAGTQKLNTLWKTEIDKATTIYGSRVQNQSLTKTLFFSHLHNGYQLLSGISKSAEDILKQTLMINAIEDASNNKLSELGAPSNYAATKALLQQRSAYAVAGEIAARTLPLFKNVIEALSYALFIFIVVLALLPNGYRILLTYGGILVWTQLWAPLYAVLNLIMTLYGKGETKSLIGTDLTLLNSSAVINANADMVTLAAWLSVSIPFISYGILKQGAAAFVGLAQHLGSAMQSAASGAAAETVSGNISLGNFTMGTQAYQNATAFQHNTSPNYNASQFKSLSAAGLETSTFAGGNQALTDQAISRLGIQIMGTENTSFATQESLNHASSLFRSTSIAANEATETAFQKTTQFLSQVSEAFSQGDERSQSLTASDAKSLQDFKNYVKDIQQRTGLSHAQAVEVGVAAKLGTPEILGFSLSGQGSFSSQATNQQDMASAQSIADQKNYTESLERILSAAESYSKARNNTALAELGKSATSNLNKAQSLLRETSVAKNQMDTLSKELSANQSQTLTITKDLTQPLLEFIASQPVNMGPGSARSFRGDEKSHSRMGMEGARRILEQGGPEFKAYMDRFQEENPQYKIQSIHYGQERRNLDQTYQKEALQIKEKSPLSQHHLDNVHKVAAQGKEKNLSLASLNAQQRASPILTQQMTTVFQQVDKTLNQRKEDLSTHEEHLQKEREILDKKTLGGAAVKNLLKSGGKGILNVIEDLPPAPPLIFP